MFIVKHTGRKGRLFHPAGVNNLTARCPNRKDRKWLSIPSLHSWAVQAMYGPLSQSESHKLTRYGIRPLETMGIVYKEMLAKPKRSELLQSLIKLSKQANDYRHLEYVRVNWRTGQLDEGDIPFSAVIALIYNKKN